MGSPESPPDVTREEVRGLFGRGDCPYTPITAAEAATDLGCSQETARQTLRELAEREDVRTKRLDTGTRVWWRCADGRSADHYVDREEFRTFIDTVEEYAIFTLDVDGVVESWNEGAERIKGYAEDDIVGEHFSTFYTDADVTDGVPEQNLEIAAARGHIEDEGWRVRQDGSQFWANVTITAVRGDDGTLRGFTKVTRDMTERREYEAQLRRERDLTERTLQTVPVSIGVIDGDGQLVRANQRLLDHFGIDESDLPEFTLSSVEVFDVHGEPIPPEDRPSNRVLETGDPVDGFQCRVDLPNGGRQWLSINAAPLEDGPHDAERAVTVIEDVTAQKEHERELRREYDQTEKLLRTAPVAIAVQNAEGETLMANQRAQEALGLSEREIIDEPQDDGWQIYDSDGDPIAADQTPSARVAATGEPVLGEELVVERPSGERMQFRLNAAPVSGPGGTIERVITAGEDITALKERERQLEQRKVELETELSRILDRVSDAFYALDDEWQFTHLNERAAEVMQRPPDALLGQDIWEVFPDASEGIYWEMLHSAMETQEPVSFEVYEETLGAWLEYNVYPSESGLSIYFRDVTERIERERELERYETIVEAVTDGVYVVDEDGRFTMVNEAYLEMLEYDRDELLGEHVSTVVDDDVRRRARQLEAAMLDDGEDEPVLEAELETASGDPIQLEATFALLPVADGREHRVGVVRDVTERAERERDLQRTERRFEAIFEDPNILVALLEPDGTVLDINGTAMEYIDADLEDVTGERFWETPWWGASDSVRPDVREWTERAAAGEYVEFEADLTRPNGQRYTLDGIFRPVTDDEGEVVSIVVSDRDITERKNHERQLRKSEQRYRTLAQNVPNGIVTMFDDDLRYTLAAGRAFDDLPLSASDVEGRSVQDVWPDDITGTLETAFRSALEGETRAIETQYVDRNWIVRVVPLTDDDGTVFGGMTITQDITERKAREEELERTLDLLGKTERIADVGGWEIDPDTEEVFWTDHVFDLLAVPYDEEPPLEEALDMYHEDDQPILESAVEDALDTGQPFDVEVRVRTLSGEVRWLRLQGVPETVDDDVVSVRGAAHDITEHKAREQRLEEVIEKLEASNERLEQFAYAASHDLQEPLRMVSSYLQLIERRYADALDEDGEEYLAFAVDGADRMREMIDGLLTYSRVETQGDSLEPIEMDAVLEEALDDLQVKIDEHGAEITVETLPEITGDADQMRQVLQNLLDNAIEYSGDDPPRVHVSAERTGAEWIISVRDDGIGIGPDEQDRIFDVFHRLHSREDHPGSGIGLSLCQRIVERHGGDIWVDSQPGEGATFSFTVPAVEDELA